MLSGVSYYFYFAMNKLNVIDRIGKYLTPILQIPLLVVIFLAIFHSLCHSRRQQIIQWR